MSFMPALPILNSALDLTTATFISALIVLSILSLCFIFHLRLKSKSLVPLQDFNSLWSVRFLLVFFIFCWSIIELLRLPLFRRKYLYPFLPSLDIAKQANLCKLHIIFSLGFFEPAFLVTLLFLLNSSIRTRTPNDIWAISVVLLTCLPLAVVQWLLIFFEPLEHRLPAFFRRTAVVLKDEFGTETVLCDYPLLNSAVFAAFGSAYVVWFVFSCWRVLSLVINKGLRYRIYGLASAVLVALPLQFVCLGLTVLWNPYQEGFGVVALVVFLCAFCCAAAGEGILVIKPISDTLDAGGDCFRWIPRDGGGGSESGRLSEPEKERDGEENV